MKKGRNRSEASLSVLKSDMQLKEEMYIPPLDTFTVKVLSLRLTDDISKHFAIKVSFFDQLLLTGIIKSIGARDVIKEKTIAMGTMNYDPSDYEKMCLFANCPLVVNIQPLKSIEPNLSGRLGSPRHSLSHSSKQSVSFVKRVTDISCCNVDILPIFIDLHKMCVKKRMQPIAKVPILYRKSWENLPLLTMELSVARNKLNVIHHNVLKQANYMKLTLVGSYNMLLPYDDEYVYTAASKTPLSNGANTGIVTFNQGYRIPQNSNNINFYPKWESLRVGDDTFTKGDEKFVCNIEDLVNEDGIDIENYLTKTQPFYTTAWGSFHRTLMLEDSELWLWKHLRRYNWPLEVHIYEEYGGYSFMSFLNLFNLLYPGEDTVRLAVPLQWINSETMMEKCGCDLMLTPNEKLSSSPVTTKKASKATTESVPTSTSTDTGLIRPTGADGSSAFVIVEVKLARPLKKQVIPPHISKSEINDMLKEMEQCPHKRECTGRGQLDRDWQVTVRNAANSIRRVPYYGMTEFCTFNRQLSETRTRVELTTSCWQDAAVYVNNNFVIQEFLQSDDTFEEMLMMAHACLMRTACDTLVGVDNWQDLDPILRAARHARQMQDTPHALDLYLQLVVQKPRDENSWRELGICLQDVDRDWANVCINKSVVLNPRHPLSLLSKACMIFEEDPDAAEPFFVAILSLYPFWSTAWIATNAYYIERQLFHMADAVMEYIKKARAEGLLEDIGYARAWERELGDWWDPTPLLPGMNSYYDVADLLLRLRANRLAEVCVARALSEAGESAAYFHLVALCCRLRGNYKDALCHIESGLKKFGEISYLRILEAECYHKQSNSAASMATFEKAGSYISAYSILLSMPSREPQRARAVLVDLVRRQPSAYAWMSLADDWMMRAAMGESGDAGTTEKQVAAKTCAAACAVQALKWDRRAGRAWALLAKLVKQSARRQHCINMAMICGYKISHERLESNLEHKQSICQQLGAALRECRCQLCGHLHF